MRVTQTRRNLELKYRCADLAMARRRAEAMGAEDRGLLHQEDTFFHARQARLKLRGFGDGRAELISYLRPDIAEARGSDYLICPVSRADQLAAVLGHALGALGVVKKKRHLFCYRHTRIHLDDVVGLGTFVELETVLSGLSEAKGRLELRHVADALDLRSVDRVPQPYVELLRRIAEGEDA